MTAQTTTTTRKAPRLQLEFNHDFPAPMPEKLQHENAPLLAQYLNAWTRAFGEPNYREDGDVEHFVENMARFDAASRAFGYANTRILHTAGKHLSSLCDFHGAPILSTEEALLPEPAFVFGPVSSWCDEHHTGRRKDPADHYWEIPAFESLSGRHWALAGYFPDDQNEPDLLGVLQGMFDDGIRRFVVKGTAAKTLLVKFTLTVRPTDLFGRGSEIPSEIIDSALHLEGRSGVFLVQEHIPMVDEYRFFMAGDRPASGAGCIEHFTPLDSRGTAFDGRVEGKRNSGCVRDDVEVVNRLRDFAAAAGRILYEQAPALGAAWVMDLAVNQETGEVVLIELNPARNAGLYASSPSAWMGAVRDSLSARSVTFDSDEKEGAT
ncbi:hypothetical protein WMO79_01075 [Micrococcaceae bacterium Sec7.4]